MKFGFDWPSGFGEDLWKWWTDKDNGRMDGTWLYYKLTNEPKGSGELKILYTVQANQQMKSHLLTNVM